MEHKCNQKLSKSGYGPEEKDGSSLHRVLSHSGSSNLVMNKKRFFEFPMAILGFETKATQIRYAFVNQMEFLCLTLGICPVPAKG